MLSVINLISQFYLIILMLRLLLEWTGASGHNLICHWLVKFTQPVLQPLQSILTSKGHFNWSCLLVIVLISTLQLLLLIWINKQTLPNIGHLAIAVVGNLCYLTARIFFWGIIAYVILNWISIVNHSTTPLQEALYYLTKPLLSPAQHIIPPIGGIDLSPIPVLILLQFFIRFIATPLMVFGWG